MMPFKSEKQRAWMHAKYPAMAKRWEAETPPGKLPKYARLRKKIHGTAQEANRKHPA